MNVTMVLDLQYGSTGKGLVSSYLTDPGECGKYYDTVMSANMPNAGHTAYDQHGVKFVHKALPSGVFYNPQNVAIGPGAVIDPVRLADEIYNLKEHGHCMSTDFFVHECATVLTSDMKTQEETSTLTKIASTTSGAMAAQVRKMARNPDDMVIAKGNLSIPGVMLLSSKDWTDMVYGSHSILAEGAQGFSLGINQSQFYPFVTSRDCTPARFMADMALPHRSLREVVGVARTFPIRVGNAQGWSGPHYPDQVETTWEDLGQAPEITTVTGRVRRVFTFSRLQMAEALRAVQPDLVFLNFVNYLNPDNPSNSQWLQSVADLCRQHNSSLRWLGHGPKVTDVEDLWNK